MSVLVPMRSARRPSTSYDSGLILLMTCSSLYFGYLLGAGAMIIGGQVAVFLGVDAEGKSLEDIATPLSVIAKPPQAIFRTGAHEDLDPPPAGT